MGRKVLLSPDPEDIESYQRLCLAKQLRLKGSTLAEIAGTLQVSIDTVNRALKKIPECRDIRVNTGRSRRLAKQKQK